MDTHSRQDLSHEMFGIAINQAQPKGNHILAHCHPHYELLYILKGTRKVAMHGTTWTARGGDLLMYRPDETHAETVSTRRISFIYLRIRSEQLAAAGIGFPAPELLPPVMRLPWKNRFMDLFSRIHEEQRDRKPDSEVIMGAYLIEFAVLLRRAAEISMRERTDGVDDATRRMGMLTGILQTSMDGNRMLSDMAKGAFMSVSHFSHTFKNATGIPPKQFLIGERIERAKQLLATSTQSAASIAVELGYDSPSFFYRQFKQKTGMTPNHFRSQSRMAKK